MDEENLNYLTMKSLRDLENTSPTDLRKIVNFLTRDFHYGNQGCIVCGNSNDNMIYLLHEDEYICEYCLSYFSYLRCNDCHSVTFVIDYKTPYMFWDYQASRDVCESCLVPNKIVLQTIIESDLSTEEISYSPLNTKKRSFQEKNLKWKQENPAESDYNMDFDLQDPFKVHVMKNFCPFVKDENYSGFIKKYDIISILFVCDKEELFSWEIVTPELFINIILCLRHYNVPACLRKYLFKFVTFGPVSVPKRNKCINYFFTGAKKKVITSQYITPKLFPVQ